MKKSLTVIASLALLLTASACSIKTGMADLQSTEVQKFDPKFGDTWEIEVHSPRFAKNHLDVSVSGAINSIESKGELQTTRGTIDQFETKLYDFRLTSRLYPLGEQVFVGMIPYVGGGLGYYKLESTSNAPGKSVSCPPSHSFGFSCFEIAENHSTLADGAYAHVVGGLYIPLHAYVPGETKSVFGIVVEDRYDFGKTDGNYKLGGNLFLVGLTFRFL